jgi:hypothetical protein
MMLVEGKNHVLVKIWKEVGKRFWNKVSHFKRFGATIIGIDVDVINDVVSIVNAITPISETKLCLMRMTPWKPSC